MMNRHKDEIKTTPGIAPGKYAEIRAGITNVELANNEEL